MESLTSSNVSQTEPSSAVTAEDKPEFKEEDGLKVDKRSKQHYLMGHGGPRQHMTALKCPGCKMLTSHSVIDLTMYPADDTVEHVRKRIIGCQNCGKISTK